MRANRLNAGNGVLDNNEGRPVDVTFTGPLILFGVPLESRDGATKGYVDTRFGSLTVNDVKSGTLSVERLPSFTGDVTNVAGSGVFTLNPTGVSAGTYRKVTVDAKGRIIGSSALVSSDLPDLSWTKITKNKPATLTGFGIIDGINLNGDVAPSWLKSTATPTQASHAATKGYLDTVSAAAGSKVNAGVIVPFPTTTTPPGYLRCNGGEISKTSYASLYSTVGDGYNVSVTPGNGKPWQYQLDINKDQYAEITGWITDSPVPLTLFSRSVLVTKNRVYLLGGYTGASVNGSVYTAPINSNGTIGEWVIGTALPVPITGGELIVTKNRAHLIGGSNGGPLASVYSAPINTDGTLGTWVASGNLPGVLCYMSSVVTKNYVYIVSGSTTGGTGLTTVYVAPINEDGTLGTWVVSGSLPTGRMWSQTVVTKNRVYSLGGALTNGAADNKVYVAPINPNGTIGEWTIDAPLPIALGMTQAVITKNRVYLLGGWTTGLYLSNCYSAPINRDGTIGEWVTCTPLPSTLSRSSVVVTSSRVYLLGGTRTGSAGLTTVYSAPFSGGDNDYSKYYDGTVGLTNPTNFCLPDYTLQETPEQRYYIKY